MTAPAGHYYMGWWGHLGGPKQKHIVRYGLSPNAQRPLKDFWQPRNLFRRFTGQVLYVAVPVGIYYYIYDSATKYNEWLYTKAGKETLDRINAAS